MPALRTREQPISARIMRDAKDYFGKADALALALKGAGFTGEAGQPYRDSTISKWILGQTTIPAEVLIAAATLANLSIDDYIAGPEAAGTDARDRERLAELERQVAAMTARQDEIWAAIEDLANTFRGQKGESKGKK